MFRLLFTLATRNSIVFQAPKIPKSGNPTSRFHCVTRTSNPAIQLILDEAGEDNQSSQEPIRRPSPGNGKIPGCRESGSDIQNASHPWPEWVDMIEELVKNGYFPGDGNPFPRNDEPRNQIRTACLKFARDKFDLVRYLSRKDIEMIAEAGCPSIDRKVVNSGKRLRAHLGIDEGNVCSSCTLRGNCERAYVKVREDKGGGPTVDVMRFLLTYGLDPIFFRVENTPFLNKRVKESVRKLLKETVEFSRRAVGGGNETQSDVKVRWSSTQEIAENHRDSPTNVQLRPGDWLCKNCNFLNFARNIKCLSCNGLSQERLHNLGVLQQDNLPLKKGDWICDKCNFLNFAKNSRCLQCKENPPKRLLHPGEWECESCNYINFRRNMVCLKCDHRRHRASHSVSYHHSRAPYIGTEKLFIDGAGMSSFSLEREMRRTDFPILGGKSAISQNARKTRE
ncbi:hypothetical protein DM860_009019 [Cuscuta australis]|uniref:RanBP2-type domain-containing protein n=1 Tax=Cuscuta australis TaxID=267555 RepID=A0A328D7T2_9ASTE|nr:hypothetical protein DM860_009019 [Cuscuta australis]